MTAAASNPAGLSAIAVVGATGAVGREMLAILHERGLPHRSLRVFASARSAGQTLEHPGGATKIEELGPGSMRGVDIALFSAGSAASKAFAPAAAKAGTVVIDNSSAFRMEPGVPLIVPGVNDEALGRLEPGRGAILPVGNCSAIILLVGVNALRRAFGIERLVVATYQAASGAGAQAMEELREQTRAALAGEQREPRIFHEPYAFNLFSHNAAMDPVTGLNGEEAKVIAECRKVWNDPGLRISATCIRVPVMRAHTEVVNLTLTRPATLDQVRAALAGDPGVQLVDDRAKNLFPTPLKASGKDRVLVGRLREDPSQTPDRWKPGQPTRGYDLLISGDQLRKGAALTAIEIAEMVIAGWK